MVEFNPLVAPLFVPANRPELFVKATASNADAIIIDLEDAVPVHEKDTARQGLIEGLQDLEKPVYLRINAYDTPWFEADLDAAAKLNVSGVILAKTENASDITSVLAVTGNKIHIIALVETVLGLSNLKDIAASDVLAQFAFGSIDYALDLGCEENREALLFARNELVFQSRLANLPPPIDGVTVDISDTEVLRSDSNYAARLGFGGKLAIHPAQIAEIQTAFTPSDEQLAWAKEVLAVADTSCGAAIQFNGQMIDRPIIEKAKRMVARSNT